jgi:hypothetical protein
MPDSARLAEPGTKIQSAFDKPPQETNMPISFDISPELDLIIYFCTGIITGAEYFKLMLKSSRCRLSDSRPGMTI